MNVGQLQSCTIVLHHECSDFQQDLQLLLLLNDCVSGFAVMTGLHVIRQTWQCCRIECASAPQRYSALEGAKDTVCI